MKLGFVGLGNMGFPMAGHLLAAGHELTVFNRGAAKGKAWMAAHTHSAARLAASPVELVAQAEGLFSCVGDDQDLSDLAFDSGVLDRLKPGTFWVDHSTVSASLSRRLARECASRGVEFFDAPVSGGQSGAQEGVLTVMVGGDRAGFERIKPLIGHFAKAVAYMGPAGSGQLTKMVNQVAVAGLIQALAEGLNLARRSGLDAQQVVEVISQGAAQSWQMDHRALSMLEGSFDFGFAVDWMVKDLKMCAEQGDACGAALPMTQAVLARYQRLQGAGDGRLDTSSLIKLLDLE